LLGLKRNDLGGGDWRGEVEAMASTAAERARCLWPLAW
jgi:hypothetical protein